jgi:hypothetical protein
MSENTAGMDPRFDPRFQRGYVPDAAARPDPIPSQRAPDRAAPVTGFGDSVDTPPRLVATRGGAVESPNPVTETERVTDATAADAGADDPAAALREMLVHAQGERLDASGRDAGAGQDQPQLDAGPVVDASPARWFWIALAACILFVVVGVALFWNGASDRTTFMTAPSGVEGVFHQYSMMLAPALVQAGTIGAVAVLVIWAIRGRRTAGAVE